MAANLKEVRERIRSVQNTQQITKAMKMVSAAKLRRAQDAILSMRPYAEKLNGMLRNILSNLEGDADTVFGQQRELKNACLVVITSDRGLCGAFNTNVCKAAVHTIETKFADAYANGNLTIMCIGKRGFDYFRKRYADARIDKSHVNLFHDLSFENISKAAKGLLNAFEKQEFDAVDIAYGKFKNAATQYTITEQFLPVAKIEKEEGETMLADYIFEPGKVELLQYLVPTILQTQFQKCLLDTHASEHGARMTAMDKATENANELLRDLRISYNKARQEAITNEILEIVGGAAALEQG
ncbi:MAG: ATP synthase F1 subunit gamma [Lewinellaceae bacterium]|nr:ATP synthase F1 subunit gamma [Lewinellaceae bacterium]